MTKSARGRPLKYGRPSRVVAVTLPEDTIQHLLQIDSDIGRAIVTIVSDLAAKDALPRRPIVDFEKVSRRRSLIVVSREALKGVPGCELIPLSEEHAFLALDYGRSLPDLELAIIDRLSDTRVTRHQREGLEALRQALRDCRRAPDIEVEARSILIVEKAARRKS
jgi:hypothetical protein